jgi:hypothetical protein
MSKSIKDRIVEASSSNQTSSLSFVKMTAGSIWNTYRVEDVMTGEQYMFRRLHIDQIDESVGSGMELFKHRVAVENAMKQALPEWMLEHHIIVHTSAWMTHDKSLGYMLEPYVPDAFSFTDDEFLRMTHNDPREARRLVYQTVYLFKTLFEHGFVQGDAHLGNILISRNTHDTAKLGHYKVVLIDLDWAHSQDVPFSKNQVKSLEKLCTDYEQDEFPDSPCDPENEVSDFFCNYRAAALRTSGSVDGHVLPFVDLSVFAYSMYYDFTCTDIASQVPQDFLDFIQQFYNSAYSVDFDVTLFFKMAKRNT